MSEQDKNLVNTYKNTVDFKIEDDDILGEIILLNSGSIITTNYTEDKKCIECDTSLLNQYVITLGCNHSFHRNCIINKIFYEEEKCPGCDKSKNNKSDKTKEIISCVICMEELEESKKYQCQECKNVYHKSCALEYIYNNSSDDDCPICAVNNIKQRTREEQEANQNYTYNDFEDYFNNYANSA
jgi:hypothetical protein